jgi:hypothetical protein
MVQGEAPATMNPRPSQPSPARRKFKVHQEMFMQAQVITSSMRPTVALADYDFLRATYDMLLRAPVRNQAAIDAAFDALDAAHARLKAAHLRQHNGLMN